MLVPLNAFVGGFRELLNIFPLIESVSLLDKPTSPSHAKKPILASLLSITLREFKVIFN